MISVALQRLLLLELFNASQLHFLKAVVIFDLTLKNHHRLTKLALHAGFIVCGSSEIADELYSLKIKSCHKLHGT